MNLFQNGEDLYQSLYSYLKESISIYIYCPYIKLETLQSLIDDNTNVKCVFVRWEPKDFIHGSSDIEIYDYLKSKRISLFRNNRIHLKAYLDNYKRCFLTTANISSRALNYPVHLDYNYEIGTSLNELAIKDCLYFSMIENTSTLITDDIYTQIYNQLENISNEYNPENDYNFYIEEPDNQYLISSLPMTYDIERFVELYYGTNILNHPEFTCYLHDVSLYKIPLGLSKFDLLITLKQMFYSHPFINAFLTNLNITGEIYFGTAKDWIHKNCTDVPTPRKWDITENIKILYNWIVELSDGKYAVDRPNHSQRLHLNPGYRSRT